LRNVQGVLEGLREMRRLIGLVLTVIFALSATYYYLHYMVGGEDKLEPPSSGLRLWDTRRKYLMKNPFPYALQDRHKWRWVPYNVTDYEFEGDAMIENDHFYLFLFSNRDDSITIHAKMGDRITSGNELYKVHDTGTRNFGMGTRYTKIIKNTAEEIVVEHAGVGMRHGYPQDVTTIYRVTREPWLEVRPVKNVNQQGMHAKSRLAAFMFKEPGRDILIDSKRSKLAEYVKTHPGPPYDWTDQNVHPPPGCIGLINFHRAYKYEGDFIWFLTFPPGAENHRLTYHGIHYPDPFWEDFTHDAPSVGANYAYLGEKVVIGVLRFKDIWKREDVYKPIKAGEVYTTRFKAPYAGKWRIFWCISNETFLTEADVDKGATFHFTSPKNGTLEYVVMYMYDRNEKTPKEIKTPMDVYRETILSEG